jgi:hypothetical protein
MVWVPALDDLVSGLIITLFMIAGVSILFGLRAFSGGDTAPFSRRGRSQVSPRREVMWTALAAAVLLAVYVVAR